MEETPVVEETPAAEETTAESIFDEKPFTLNLEGQIPEEEPKKKRDPKKTKLIVRLVAGVTALAVLVVCLLGFFAWDWGDYVKDFFNRMKAPEDYMQLVEANALSDPQALSELALAKQIVMGYYAGLEQDADTGGVDIGVQLLVGNGLKDMTKTLSGLGMGLDEDLLELLQVLEQVELRIDTAIDNSDMQILLDAGINGEDIVGIQMVTDVENECIVLGIPGLTEETVQISLEEMELDPAMLAAIPEMMQISRNFVNELPSEQAVSQLLDRCIQAGVAEIDNVERENGTVSAGGVEQNVTVLTYKISEETFKNMLLAIMKEAEGDETLMQILTAYETMTTDMNALVKSSGLEDMDVSYPVVKADEVMEQLSEAIDSYAEAEATDDTAMKIETYVNRKGQIIGRKLRVPEEDVSITYVRTIKGRNIGVLVEMDVDGEKLTGEGSAIWKKNKLNGEITVEFDGEEMLIVKLQDVDATSGTLRIELGEGLQEELEDEVSMAAMVDLAIEVTIQEKTTTVWLLMDNKQILGLGTNYDTRQIEDIITPTGAMTDVYKWAETVDTDALMEKLEQVGITEDMINALADLLEDADIL